MKGKLVAVLFVVVFVLLIAVVFSLLTDDQSVTDINDYRIQAQTTDSPVLETISTPVPTPPPAEPSWLPLPTAEPTPIPTPVPTMAPTPIPTVPPTLAPVITDLGSGSFRSNLPWYINVVADWSAKAIDANNVEVTVKVSVESYSLHLNAARSVNVAFGDQYVTLDAPNIVYDGGTQVLNELATTTFTVPLSQGMSNSYNLGVAWHFGGWYMNTEIPSIECGGTVTLIR